MPKLNHPNLGDVCRSAYLPGRVLKVYRATTDNAETLWDCADVLEVEGNVTYSACPIIYHCDRTVQRRKNGAIEDGARGFVEGDDVILLCQLVDNKKSATPADKVYVMGHLDGPKKCSYNYLLVRISKSPLISIETPLGEYTGSSYTAFKPGSHAKEYCFVFDVDAGKLADIRIPTSPTQKYTWPTTVESLKPFLDRCQYHGINLWEFGPQGDENYRIAGGTPNWKDDFQGAGIGVGPMHTGVSEYSQWFAADKCMQLYDDLRNTISTDTAGALDGTFVKSGDLWKSKKELFLGWAATSRGVLFRDELTNCDGGSFDNNYQGQLSEAAQKAIQQLENEIAALEASIKKEQEFMLSLSEQISNMDKNIALASSEMATLQTQIAQATFETPTKTLRFWLNRVEELKQLISSLGSQKQLALNDADAGNIRIDKNRAEIESRREEIRQILAGQKVPGAWGYAVDKNGVFLKNSSMHAQVGYGEDEIWTCALNSYMGMVVSYCDAKWKFMRFPNFPPVIPLTSPALTRLASGAGVVPGVGGGGSIVGDIGLMLAADITQSALDGNSIFRCASLKMVHEAGYNRTSAPAIKTAGKFFGPGSYRLRMTTIPGDPKAPLFDSALNTRVESVDVWDRDDNWHNSIQYSCSSKDVNRTFFFRSMSQQWRFKMVFIDTPLGSMFGPVPHVQVGLWYVPELYLSSGMNTARQDWPLNNHFTKAAKHSNQVVCQVYIVQRQGITLWNEHDKPSQKFIVQHAGRGPYDCHYWQNSVPDPIGLDGKSTLPAPNDPVAFIKQSGNLVGHISAVDNLTPYMTSRVYWRSYASGESAPTTRSHLSQSVHEVEIMASADLYNKLQKTYGRKHPNDQVRNPVLEKSIEDLIKHYYTTEGAAATELHFFNLDVEVL